MPKYEATPRESAFLLSGAVDVQEQNYSGFEDMSFKELEDDKNALDCIATEAYNRVAFAWKNHFKDDEIDEYFVELKNNVEVDMNKVLNKIDAKEDEKNVAKKILQQYMIEILMKAKKIDEEYYRAAIQAYRGMNTPFLFSPECYKKRPYEVNYDEEFKKNREFWLGEIVEYLCTLYKSAFDPSIMPFIQSTILNRAKEYFLRFEEEPKIAAKKVFENIKEKVKSR